MRANSTSYWINWTTGCPSNGDAHPRKFAASIWSWPTAQCPRDGDTRTTKFAGSSRCASWTADNAYLSYTRRQRFTATSKHLNGKQAKQPRTTHTERGTHVPRAGPDRQHTGQSRPVQTTKAQNGAPGASDAQLPPGSRNGPRITRQTDDEEEIQVRSETEFMIAPRTQAHSTPSMEEFAVNLANHHNSSVPSTHPQMSTQETHYRSYTTWCLQVNKTDPPPTTRKPRKSPLFPYLKVCEK
jgi:hypothetical protein